MVYSRPPPIIRDREGGRPPPKPQTPLFQTLEYPLASAMCTSVSNSWDLVYISTFAHHLWHKICCCCTLIITKCIGHKSYPKFFYFEILGVLCSQPWRLCQLMGCDDGACTGMAAPHRHSTPASSSYCPNKGMHNTKIGFLDFHLEMCSHATQEINDRNTIYVSSFLLHKPQVLGVECQRMSESQNWPMRG